MRKLAAIYQKPSGKYWARILFENATSLVEYFRIDIDRGTVVGSVLADFDGLQVVETHRIEAEIAYVALFGERAEMDSLAPLVKPSMDDLIEHHRKMIGGSNG